MRSFDEVGKFKHVSEEVNEAFRTYASIWLDFVDDNISHFTWRNHDVAPIEGVEESGFYKAYMDAAADIAKMVLSGGYYKSMKELYEDYPLLKERAEELEAVFHEPEGEKDLSPLEKAEMLIRRFFERGHGYTDSPDLKYLSQGYGDKHIMLCNTLLSDGRTNKEHDVKVFVNILPFSASILTEIDGRSFEREYAGIDELVEKELENLDEKILLNISEDMWDAVRRHEVRDSGEPIVAGDLRYIKWLPDKSRSNPHWTSEAFSVKLFGEDHEIERYTEDIDGDCCCVRISMDGTDIRELSETPMEDAEYRKVDGMLEVEQRTAWYGLELAKAGNAEDLERIREYLENEDMAEDIKERVLALYRAREAEIELEKDMDDGMER